MSNKAFSNLYWYLTGLWRIKPSKMVISVKKNKTWVLNYLTKVPHYVVGSFLGKRSSGLFLLSDGSIPASYNTKFSRGLGIICLQKCEQT